MLYALVLICNTYVPGAEKVTGAVTRMHPAFGKMRPSIAERVLPPIVVLLMLAGPEMPGQLVPGAPVTVAPGGSTRVAARPP